MKRNGEIQAKKFSELLKNIQVAFFDPSYFACFIFKPKLRYDFFQSNIQHILYYSTVELGRCFVTFKTPITRSLCLLDFAEGKRAFNSTI